MTRPRNPILTDPPMIRIDWHPDEAKLQQFGWISLGGFGLLASIAWWRFGNGNAALVLAGLALLTPVVGMVSPRLLKFLYIGLSLVAFPIGLIISNVLLLLIFLLVFTPVALIFRLIGRDELRLKPAHESPSHWKTYESGRRKPASYYRTF